MKKEYENIKVAVECDDFDVAIDIVKQLKATDRDRGELLSRLSTLKE